MSDDSIRALGISGSLRRGSFNSALLHAAAGLVPEGMTLEIADLRHIPLYDADVERDGLPAPVVELRNRIASVDALVIATPEYNYSIPGVLKNAIDWLSRPPNQPLAGKPLAILGASAGALGTARAQLHLRQVCVYVDMLPINKPEVLVARAAEKFDAELHLTDDVAKKLVTESMRALASWARRLRASR